MYQRFGILVVQTSSLYISSIIQPHILRFVKKELRPPSSHNEKKNWEEEMYYINLSITTYHSRAKNHKHINEMDRKFTQNISGLLSWIYLIIFMIYTSVNIDV